MAIVVNVPASFKHHAAIYQPRDGYAEPGRIAKSQFSMMLPAETAEFTNCRIKTRNQATGEFYPTPCVSASTNRQPVIMIGDGSFEDENKWRWLCERANRFNIPLDTLLIDRPLKVAVSLWRPVGQFASGRDALTINAVQILGDLTKSPILDEKIAEIKGWFDGG